MPNITSPLRSERHRQGLTLQALAERVGISVPYLSQVERGLRNPSASSLALIAVGLGHDELAEALDRWLPGW
jgi:transcriptional regulator with XRE-family HTH domain